MDKLNELLGLIAARAMFAFELRGANGSYLHSVVHYAGSNVRTAQSVLSILLIFFSKNGSAGSLGAVLVLASTLFSNYVSLISPIYIGLDAWKIALPLHLIGWVAQVQETYDYFQH